VSRRGREPGPRTGRS